MKVSKPTISLLLVLSVITLGIWYLDESQREYKMINDCVKEMTYWAAISGNYSVEGEAGYHYLGYELKKGNHDRMYVYAWATKVDPEYTRKLLKGKAENLPLPDSYQMRCTIDTSTIYILTYVEKMDKNSKWVPVNFKHSLEETLSHLTNNKDV